MKQSYLHIPIDKVVMSKTVSQPEIKIIGLKVIIVDMRFISVVLITN